MTGMCRLLMKVWLTTKVVSADEAAREKPRRHAPSPPRTKSTLRAKPAPPETPR